MNPLFQLFLIFEIYHDTKFGENLNDSPVYSLLCTVICKLSRTKNPGDNQKGPGTVGWAWDFRDLGGFQKHWGEAERGPGWNEEGP